MRAGEVVPVVLLTGFLGSGKTTLLNRMMAARQRNPSSGKLAVLVNELGSIGIDAALLPAGARQVELAGGCICCTLDENLEQSLTELVDAEPEIELVVIETTGIAEPLPIVWTLTGESLASRVRLATVVTVVDALEHERHRPLAPSVDAQVEHADILVISKHDALPADRAADALEVLRASLVAANGQATILVESDPTASADALWRLLDDPMTHTASAPRGLAHLAGDGHNHDEAVVPGDHGATHGFDVVAVPIEGTLDFEELSSELEALPPTYVRIKGICWAIDRSTGSEDRALIAFHRVGARVSAEPLVDAASSADPAFVPRAVALGFGVQADRLAACLRAAMIPSKR